MSPVRVFHCDDSSAFRVLVREMLGELGQVTIVGEASSVEEAVAGLPSADPDVVLVDLLDPGREEDLVDRLRAAAPRARFLLYTGMPEGSVPAGQRHVHKSVSFDELHRIITEVAAAPT